MSVGSDLALPEVMGRRSPRVRLVNAYLGRLRATAAHDRAVASAFSEVVGMLQPPSHVLRPAIALRVARGPRAARGSEPLAGGLVAAADEYHPESARALRAS
jgi:hypothetical protein